jgi:hypothetical protein
MISQYVQHGATSQYDNVPVFSEFSQKDGTKQLDSREPNILTRIRHYGQPSGTNHYYNDLISFQS